jgi:methylated-DNA-[protein]-cysteine S-methyltransferase
MKHPDTLQRCSIDSPLGPLLLAASEHGLAGVWFHDQQHRPADVTVATWRENLSHPLLQQAARQINTYFQSTPGTAQPFTLPLDISAGTAFQQTVWRALLGIPAGETCSYAQIAHAVDRPAAVRAVGAAIGRNPLSILVPCHRVLGSGGALTGYAGGLARKTALLAGEGASIRAPLKPHQ